MYPDPELVTFGLSLTPQEANELLYVLGRARTLRLGDNGPVSKTEQALIKGIRVHELAGEYARADELARSLRQQYEELVFNRE